MIHYFLHKFNRPVSLLIILHATACNLFLSAQNTVARGSLTSDTAEITIISVYPDSFPNISVVFKAEKNNGDPCWGLTPEKMHVRENGLDGKVISVNPISEKRPVNLSIVVDHSGSMSIDQSLFMDTTLTWVQIDSMIHDTTMRSPLENAKRAVKTFVTGFDSTKDYISIIGFSSSVYPRIPLSQNIGTMKSAIESMQPDGSTALYDAMLNGLDDLGGSDEVNVLVVLTDGNDNASVAHYNDVIARAQERNIPVYIIGLGAANQDTLRLIAESTNGRFYYTNNSRSLLDIYNDISKHIQAYYELVYESPNLASADTSREILIWFDTDSMYLVGDTLTKDLPKEVVAYLSSKERERSYELYGGIALVGLISAGALLYRYNRKKKSKSSPTIVNLFPNPTDGNISIEYSGNTGTLQVVDANGISQKQVAVASGLSSFDFSDLPAGTYIVRIAADGENSNAIKMILQK